MGETLRGQAALYAEAKKDLRIKSASEAVEDEIKELVSSALADMAMHNVDSERLCPDGATLSEMSSLGVRAVKFYVKAHFGTSTSRGGDSAQARYKDCYDTLVNSMSLTLEYRKDES